MTDTTIGALLANLPKRKCLDCGKDMIAPHPYRKRCEGCSEIERLRQMRDRFKERYHNEPGFKEYHLAKAKKK